MPKILIDILSERGHLNGSLKIASMLKDAGHDVLYLNQEFFSKEIKKYDIEIVRNYQYEQTFMIGKVNFNYKSFLNNFFHANRSELIKMEEQNFQSFKKFITEISPDLVLLDGLNMLKAVYYQLCDIPVVCLDNLPYSCKSKNVPPYTSFFIPFNNFFSILYCNFLWFNKNLQNKWRYTCLRLNTTGLDKFSALHRIAKQNNLNLRKIIDYQRGFNIGLKNISHIIVAPQDFDFYHTKKNGVFNVGPLVDINREGEIEKPRYNVLTKNLKKFREKNEGFVIYCSLGTNTQAFMERKNGFLRKMIKVALDNPSDMFVISAGKDNVINDFFPVPENLFVFDFIPQVDLLQNCDIMITHGGINTITECIFCEVPMLVYPLSLDWDQPGNSARVVFNEVGLRGKINKDSPKIISQKLNKIKNSYKYFKKNVGEMRQKFEEKNNSTQSIEIVESLIIKNQKSEIN